MCVCVCMYYVYIFNLGVHKSHQSKMTSACVLIVLGFLP